MAWARSSRTNLFLGGVGLAAQHPAGANFTAPFRRARCSAARSRSPSTTGPIRRSRRVLESSRRTARAPTFFCIAAKAQRHPDVVARNRAPRAAVEIIRAATSDIPDAGGGRHPQGDRRAQAMLTELTGRRRAFSARRGCCATRCSIPCCTSWTSAGELDPARVRHAQGDAALVRRCFRRARGSDILLARRHVLARPRAPCGARGAAAYPPRPRARAGSARSRCPSHRSVSEAFFRTLAKQPRALSARDRFARHTRTASSRGPGLPVSPHARSDSPRRARASTWDADRDARHAAGRRREALREGRLAPVGRRRPTRGAARHRTSGPPTSSARASANEGRRGVRRGRHSQHGVRSADAVVILDVLHYIDFPAQHAVLLSAMRAAPSGVRPACFCCA